MQYILNIKTYNNHIHYYLDDTYIGMLIFDKGELSDFRAIIRKNKLSINNENLFIMIKVSLFGLLNHYLGERFFIKDEEMETLNSKIVTINDTVLSEVTDTIIKNNMI